jgi:hypothetical protein
VVNSIRARLTFANVVSLVALFVALGGSSYAALRIGTGQIVNNSVRSRDLRNNDVRSGDVRNFSLLRKDFKRGQLPAGRQGPRGPEGPSGPAGSAAQFNGAAAGGDLAGTYPAPTIRSGTVGSPTVQDGSLRTVDLAVIRGSITQNFGSVTPQTCVNANVGAVPGLVSTDYVVLDGLWSTVYVGGGAGGLFVLPYASPASLNFKVCNPTAAAVDPPNVTFHYAVFR